MDAVLKGIIKDIWFDSLPSIKHRRNKEVSHGVISTLPKSGIDPVQRLEIEAAANATRSVSNPSQVEPNSLWPAANATQSVCNDSQAEPNGQAKSSGPLPSGTNPSSEGHAKGDD